MADCFYYKNGEIIGDTSKIVEMFFKDTKQLKNASIFSSEDIQKSTYDIIMGISDINTFNSGVRKILINGEIQEVEVPVVTDFIVQPNTLFEKLGIKTSSGRLNPEYIKENRIAAYILENYKKVEDLTSFDKDSVVYSKDLFQLYRNDDRFIKFNDNQIIFLLSEIEDIIEFENKVMRFGELLHTLLFLKVRNQSYNAELNKFIKDPNNKDIIGEGSADQWKSKISYIINSIYDKIINIGLPITEIFLNSDVVRGRVDLIAVDRSGNAHIFDLKVSKNSYDNWDSAKLGTLDWQLAMYRQLLGQHINIDNTMLYTIPIKISYLGDPNVVYLEDFQNRSLTKRLRPEGEITVFANKILPRRIVTDYNPERESNILSKLNTLFKGEDYEIKTDIVQLDPEKILKLAEDTFARTGRWKYWPEVEIAGEAKTYITGDTREEFEANLNNYLQRANKLVNNEALLIRDAIKSAILNKTRITTSKNDEYNILLNKLFGNYISDDWEVVNNIPEAIAMGIILLRNKLNNNISIVSMTTNQPYAISKVDGLNYGELEFMKSFLFVNEMKKELFPGGYGKLGQIIVLNPHTTNGIYIRNVNSKFKIFEQLMYSKGLGDSLNLDASNISAIEDIALYELDSLYRSYNGEYKKEIDSIFEPIKNKSISSIELDILMDIEEAMLNKFPQYREKTFTTELNFDDPIERLLAQLKVAIVSKGGFELANDFQNLSMFSFSFADFGDLITSLFTENKKEYTRTGKRIEGLLGGMIWSPPDWALSKDIKNINKMMSLSNQHIREWILKVSTDIHNHTKKYYKNLGFSSLEQNIWGETQSKYKNLWYQNDDGTVSEMFRTKDPYVMNERNFLQDFEREYLQNILLIINQWKLELTDDEIKGLDPKNIESLKKNDKIAKALEDGTYFDMPLVRREEISRHSHLLKKGSIGRKIAPYFNDVNDFLDTRELLKEDLDVIKNRNKGFYQMFDPYGHQSKDFIAKSVQKYGVEYFEWNLDTIANRIAFSKIRKKVYDRRLPIINSYVWWIKLMAGRENVDISKQLEAIANQMKLSIFDDKIIDEEFEDVSKIAGIVKQISTAGMLAFKPASYVKEMTIGLFKAITLGATKLYGKNEFSFKDVYKAYVKLTTIDKKFALEHNLIDKLNFYYGFANMDVNTMTKKLQTDRRGIMRGLGRYMFAANTIPDYANRLAILLAKMIKDGSYEAHSLSEDGQLVYDPFKDKRFSHYLENREKYKQDGVYVPSKTDALYNEQRQKYLLLIDLLNKEYSGSEKFTEESIVPKAYSETERSSLKSFSDLVYGYYEKDSQSPANNTWWGIIYLQFMQFWPAKMKMWLAKPTDESPMGHMEQATVVEDGKTKLLWKEHILDEEGNFTFDENGQIKFVPTTKNTGDPIYQWKGSPYEGLMYSVLGTIKDIVTLNFEDIKHNSEKTYGDRNRRVLFALSDGFLIFMLFAMIKAILDAFREENGDEGLTGYTLRMASAIDNKILSEYNVWNSTFGSINSEPIFMQWSKKLATDAWDTISGDKELMDLMTRNFGFAEVLKWRNPQ